jgi:hypothetical protein
LLTASSSSSSSSSSWLNIPAFLISALTSGPGRLNSNFFFIAKTV